MSCPPPLLERTAPNTYRRSARVAGVLESHLDPRGGHSKRRAHSRSEAPRCPVSVRSQREAVCTIVRRQTNLAVIFHEALAGTGQSKRRWSELCGEWEHRWLACRQLSFFAVPWSSLVSLMPQLYVQLSTDKLILVARIVWLQTALYASKSSRRSFPVWRRGWPRLCLCHASW